jgi:hypothetical protein
MPSVIRALFLRVQYLTEEKDSQQPPPNKVINQQNPMTLNLYLLRLRIYKFSTLRRMSPGKLLTHISLLDSGVINH